MCADDVADAVALTFVRLLDAVDRYEPERGEPIAFLLGIAADVVRDLRRGAARRQALLARLSGRDLLDADDVDRVETATAAARATEALQGAIDRVPPGERQMLGLVAGGMPPSQAAHELGITRATGRTRLSRARRRVLDHHHDRARAARPPARPAHRRGPPRTTRS